MVKYNVILSKKVAAGNTEYITFTFSVPGRRFKVTKVCVGFDDAAVFNVTAKLLASIKDLVPDVGEFVATGSPRPLCVDTDFELAPQQTVSLRVTNSDTADHYVVLILSGELE